MMKKRFYASELLVSCGCFIQTCSTDVDHVFRDSNASIDFKDINTFGEFCNKSWNKPYGYIVIDLDNQNIKHRYRNQLELLKEEESQSGLKDPEDSVVFEDKQLKQRATKKCEQCNMQILSSSFARHLKSEAHLKKLSNN